MTSGRTLLIRSSPHLAAAHSVDKIMFHVVLALLPTSVFAIYVFGLAAFLTLIAAVTTCLATEYLLTRFAQRNVTINDGSAAVTGLLYGLTLPPSIPIWMVALGGVCAIGVGKIIFGGLGCNVFNPALIGRAFLQAAFPVAMTTWPETTGHRWTSVPPSTLAWPMTKPEYDALTGATPLTQWKFEQLPTETGELFLGTVSGSTGETSAILLLLGAIYLILRGMMSWRIPLAILVTAGALSTVCWWADSDQYSRPDIALFSGGLMLGALFMATDPVGSPITHWGGVVYGILIGTLIIIIRNWGGMPEGVMYAILFGNATTPMIDRWLQPRAFGTRRRSLLHG